MANDKEATESVNAQFNFKSELYSNWTRQMLSDASLFLKAKGARIMRRARSNVSTQSKKTGALAKAIKDKNVFKQGRAKNRIDGRIWMGVGIDSNVREKEYTAKGSMIEHRPIFYAHLVEQGFTHYPDGKLIKGKPFLRPAVNAEGGEIGIKNELEEVIDNAARGILNDESKFKFSIK